MFNMKWKKNQFGGRKVAGQATMLAHWVQTRSPAIAEGPRDAGVPVEIW